jgi:membrane protease YdiL (CAAX protease family)
VPPLYSLEILALFFLPTWLVRRRIVATCQINWILVAVFAAATVHSALAGTPLRELGIRTDNLLSAAPLYLGGALVLFALLLVSRRVLGLSTLKDWKSKAHFYGPFIPVSAAQQWIFQSFLLTQLLAPFMPLPLAVVLTALIFAETHAIYPKPFLGVTLSFIAGLFFAAVFALAPNLFLASLAHMVLNLAACYFGLFSFGERCGVEALRA